jgi:hypothetical protein
VTVQAAQPQVRGQWLTSGDSLGVAPPVISRRRQPLICFRLACLVHIKSVLKSLPSRFKKYLGQIFSATLASFGTSGSKPRCDFQLSMNWEICIKEVSESDKWFRVSNVVARFTGGCGSTSIPVYPN